MAPDDRDRMFDKALSRHLRFGGSSPAAGNLSSSAGSSIASCLDLETLAAYHERSLLPEEMNSAKEHIVGCAHCQAILAQLELTDSVPFAPVASERETVPAAAPKKARAPVPIRGPRWAWLVPAGALAAGLLVWIGLHETQPQRSLSSNEVKVARAEKPAEALPPLNKQVLTTPKAAELDENSRARETASGVSGGIAGVPPKAITSHQENLKQPAKADSGASLVSTSPSVAKESELRKDAARDSSAALTAELSQTELAAKNALAGAPQNQVVLQNQNQAANIQVQNQVLSQTQKVAGPAPLNQAVEPAKKEKSARAAALYRTAPPPQPPAPAPAPASAAFADTVSLEGRAIPNQHLIAVAGSPVRWLAGGAGLIEFSADNGASWSVQSSGVSVDLLTGSAPSDKICWMVGRAGTVLLTTDGGAHWSTVPSPLKEDPGGIRASDALHATVWNLPKTKSFETSDGGLTWKPVPAP